MEDLSMAKRNDGNALDNPSFDNTTDSNEVCIHRFDSVARTRLLFEILSIDTH